MSEIICHEFHQLDERRVVTCVLSYVITTVISSHVVVISVKKKIDKIHLGAKEFAFTDQLFVLVELDAVPQTHSAGAEET